MKTLDINNWKRKEHFNFFKEFKLPYFNICAEVDVTELVKISKLENLSFFVLSLFSAMKTANEIEEFRYRIKENKVIIYDSVNCSSTILNKDETFSFCFFKYFHDFKKFNENAKQVLLEQTKHKNGLFTHKHEDNIIHFSIIPWVSFKSFSHAREINKEDSVPKMVMGKYFKTDNKIKMPFSVEVHHALMDGLQVGKYFNCLEENISNFKKYL